MAVNEGPEAVGEPVVLARNASHVRLLTMNRAELNAFNTALWRVGPEIFLWLTWP